MGEDLLERLEEDINNYNSLEELRDKFIKEGYLENDIDDAIFKITKGAKRLSNIHVKAIKIFSWKEILDRIGYGFVTHQFINVLFYLSGASFFLVGLLNGLRSILSILMSSFLHEYSKVHDISKGVISRSGILFGFSFLVMAASIKLQLLWLFAIALVVGSLGVVTYGDFYNKIIKSTIKKEKMNHFLVRISYYGILITAVAFLISGYLMDKIPMAGTIVTFMGSRFPIYGYLLAFEISALAFIISGYFISFLDYEPEKKTYKLSRFFPEYCKIMHEKLRIFSKHKLIRLLLIVSILVSVIQVLGNSYYGIFIYNNFKDVGFGGFLNVAVVFTIAVLVSFIIPLFTKKIEKLVGLTPMLVFGIVLMALMPYTLAYNPYLPAVIIANAFSVAGAVIVGIAMGLLARHLMTEKERKYYYAGLSIASITPFIIIIPIGSYLAQELGLSIFFVGISAFITFVIMPMAFILVYLSTKNKR